MAHKQLQDRFRNAVISAVSKVKETAKVRHTGVKGRFREIFVADVIRPVLSNEFFAGSGLVVDHTGGTSRESDVVIFDRFHVPPILYKADEGLYPIEGVYYCGEVKSKLTKTGVRDSVEKFRHLRSMRPLPNVPFPQTFIFAWGSDLTGGMDAEFERYCAVDTAAGSSPAATILCVAGKGYCCVLGSPNSGYAWSMVGHADGIAEVVNFIGGIANSLIDLRMNRFGVKFGHYLIDQGVPLKLKDIVPISSAAMQ